MCVVAGGVEGAGAGDEAGEVGMGMGEVTDWTGWSGGDGSGSGRCGVARCTDSILTSNW